VPFDGNHGEGFSLREIRKIRIRYVTTCSISVRVCVPALPQ